MVWGWRGGFRFVSLSENIFVPSLAYRFVFAYAAVWIPTPASTRIFIGYEARGFKYGALSLSSCVINLSDLQFSDNSNT